MKKYVALIFIIFSFIIIYNSKDFTHQTVMIKEDTPLYLKENNQFKKVGKIYQETVLTIESKQKNYYCFNHNYCFKTNQLKITKYKKNKKKYVPFNEIITTKKTILYQNKKSFFINQSMKFRVMEKEKDDYIVLFNQELVKIPKSEISKVETDFSYPISKSVSILELSKKLTKEQQKYLKDYNVISVFEWERWRRGEINLPEHSVLLIEDKTNLNVSLDGTNQPSTKEAYYHSYIVNDSLDDFKRMVNGESFFDMNELATSIPVLNYHFFYNDEIFCNEIFCLHTDRFKEQLEYLKNNHYRVITMKEFIEWIHGNVELPKKSVLITVDDGALGTGTHNGNLLIPILEQYKMPATLFLITVWWPKENYQSEYLEIESHGYDIHRVGECNLMRIECLNHEQLTEDLKHSTNLLDTNHAFAYPYYDSTEDSISVLKELNFDVAFIGGNRKATRSDNPYLIPRYTIYDYTTLNQFIDMVN